MLVIKQFGPVTYAMGTLQEILAGTGIAAKVRALPNDVAGCTLEMGADGKWVGTLGSLSKATADALYASGALANLATGATYRDTNGTQYTYSAGAWWASEYVYFPGSQVDMGANLLPATLDSDAYLTDLGVLTPNSSFDVSDYMSVLPGDKLVIGCTAFTVTVKGCVYDSSKAFLCSINSIMSPINPDQVFIVPASGRYIRFVTQKSNDDDWWGNNFVYRYIGQYQVRNIESACAVGTSLTAGNSYGFFPWWVDFAESYGASISNGGVGSCTVATSAHDPIVGRLSAFVKSDIMFFEGGINDKGQNIPLGTPSSTDISTYYGALNKVAKYMNANFPLSRIIWWTCPRSIDADSANSLGLVLSDYMTAFKNIAAKNGYEVIDFFSVIFAGGAIKTVSMDGTHPNELGKKRQLVYAKRNIV